MTEQLSNPRHRLGKEQADHIAKTFIKRGYKVHQSTGRATTGQISDRMTIWRANKFIGALYWEPHDGWRLDLRHPTIHSEDDLTTILAVIPATEAASVATQDAWKQFQSTKSDKAWRRYLGLMASHFQSLLQPPTDEE